MDANEMKAFLDELEADLKMLDQAGETKKAEQRRRKLEELRRQIDRLPPPVNGRE